jgi:hypothetical protein
MTQAHQIEPWWASEIMTHLTGNGVAFISADGLEELEMELPAT